MVGGKSVAGSVLYIYIHPLTPQPVQMGGWLFSVSSVPRYPVYPVFWYRRAVIPAVIKNYKNRRHNIYLLNPPARFLLRNITYILEYFFLFKTAKNVKSCLKNPAALL